MATFFGRGRERQEIPSRSAFRQSVRLRKLLAEFRFKENALLTPRGRAHCLIGVVIIIVAVEWTNSRWFGQPILT